VSSGDAAVVATLVFVAALLQATLFASLDAVAALIPTKRK
jgi:hypothetical protein